MNKTTLVAEIAKRIDVERRDADRVVNVMIDIIRERVARGERVTLSDFGTFLRQRRGARVGRNPHTGVAVRIPATQKPVFRPGKAFLKQVAPRRRKPPARKGTSARRRR